MKKTLAILACTLCAAGAFAVTSYEQQSIGITSGTVTGLPAILQGIPTMDTKTANKAASDLLKMGPDGVGQLVGMLTVEPNDQNTSARYALNLVVHQSIRQGATKDRKMVAGAMAKALDSANETEIKRLLIQFLWMTGDKEQVPSVQKYLTDETLGPIATKAVLTMAGADAADALVAELLKAKGREQIALIKSLGDIRAKKAVPELMKFVEAEDAQVRLAALHALASIGAVDVRPALEKLTASENLLERGRAYAWILVLARCVAADGKKADGVEIVRSVIEKTKTDLTLSSYQAEALATLSEIQGKDAIPTLVGVLGTQSSEVRMGALNALNRMKGGEITKVLTKALDQASTITQFDLLYTLGRRGDSSALSAITPLLKSEDLDVRVAAVDAAYRVGRENAASQLLAFLIDAKDPKEAAAASEAVGRLSGAAALSRIAAALPKASKEGKIALLKVLAARRASAQKAAVFAMTADEARPVRVAAMNALSDIAAPADLEKLVTLFLAADGEQETGALQKVLVAITKMVDDPEKRAEKLLAAYESATPENKGKLLEVLTRVGGKKATDLAISETRNSNAAVRAAAVRGLSGSPDQAVGPELARIAKEGADDTEKVLALRGFVRLTGESTAPVAKKLGAFKEALGLAKGAEEKRQVVALLADIHNPESLALVTPFLDNADLQKDAASAVAKIAMPGGGDKDGIVSPEASEALAKATRLIDDVKLRMRVEKQVSKLDLQFEQESDQADADGFVKLFNGKDLSGWVGAVKGYRVEDGVLVCPKDSGGKLFTKRQYADFVFQFEFKLEAGANNGVGLRTPLVGDPAYVGYECQILDDTSDQYKDLKPYQYHGSIYGIAPAEKGHLKPVGEWNNEEITMKGSKVTVKLNGATIVDYDLAEAAKSGTADGNDHPGLKRSSGHIGFLGHGSRVEFRSIRVKELLNEAPEGFTALFNGKDLSGWKGLVENPIKRAQMKPEELAEAQKKADEAMREHWKVANGTLVFDGEGSHLCTTKDYGDFEMLVDWKIGPGGDSGIYLRGTPQVQIWDVALNGEGSGGLYNNQKSTSTPLVAADNPARQWNTFRIKMVGDKVTVHLNGKLVVDNVALENYWDRNQPIFPTGQIELQSHGSTLFFRNIFIRELGKEEPKQAPAEKATTETNQAAEPAKSETQKEKSDLVLTAECYSLVKLFQDKTITVEQVPAILKELGYSGISWNDMFFTSWEPEYLEKLNKAAADAGIQPMCLIIEGNLATGNEEARKKQIEDDAKKLRAAKALKVPVVRINLGRTESEDDNGTVGVERCIAAFKELLPLAKELDIKITIENHGGPSKKADWILRIINGTDPKYVGSCLDFGNWPAEPKELRYEEIAKLAKYAYHLHVKTFGFDANGEDTRVDMKRCFEMMKQAGYKGAVSVEWEGKEPADPKEALKLSKALIQKHWPEVK